MRKYILHGRSSLRAVLARSLAPIRPGCEAMADSAAPQQRAEGVTRSSASSSSAASTPALPVATAISEGLQSVLTPMVDKCDDSIRAVLDSQAELSKQIDHVAAELQTFLGASQLPSFSPHAQRLADLRRRVAATSGTMTQVQARLTRIEEMADRLEQEQGLHLARRAAASTVDASLDGNS